ncbi:uncharacterized protein DDB_G0283697-like [Falco naumanni]|uniref:uncharacterized protein DDB_G0283697-like n=1 Tax=Falco naumanni TaxID=148594 RepID=UPI001ADEB7FF|nr:uncharacterized protein DDB_G0283697-like [Falco naumanni]
MSEKNKKKKVEEEEEEEVVKESGEDGSQEKKSKKKSKSEDSEIYPKVKKKKKTKRREHSSEDEDDYERRKKKKKKGKKSKDKKKKGDKSKKGKADDNFLEMYEQELRDYHSDSSNAAEDEYNKKKVYEVITVTGDVRGAGTDANVFVTLFGEFGITPKIHLTSNTDKRYLQLFYILPSKELLFPVKQLKHESL